MILTSNREMKASKISIITTQQSKFCSQLLSQKQHQPEYLPFIQRFSTTLHLFIYGNSVTCFWILWVLFAGVIVNPSSCVNWFSPIIWHEPPTCLRYNFDLWLWWRTEDLRAAKYVPESQETLHQLYGKLVRVRPRLSRAGGKPGVYWEGGRIWYCETVFRFPQSQVKVSSIAGIPSRKLMIVSCSAGW